MTGRKTKGRKISGTGRSTGPLGLGPAVISVARRVPVDVRKALERARSLVDDEKLAVALVEMAGDVDETTVLPFLETVQRIRDDTWRARTLFSVFQQTSHALTEALPPEAQDAVVHVLESVRDERARAAALRKLPERLPSLLRNRLAATASALSDPLERLRTVLSYESGRNLERGGFLLGEAKKIEDERVRGEALALVAPRLDTALLPDVSAAARLIQDPGVSSRVLVVVADLITDAAERTNAQLEILERSPAIAEPVRRFDVLAALHDLPPERKRALEATLLEQAKRFDDLELRSRALFIAGDYSDDEVLRNDAFLAGIAAADAVADVHVRAELLGLLHPIGPWLRPDVRAELRRAVERVADPEIQRNLRSQLSRLFFHEREPAQPAETVKPDPGREAHLDSAHRWDLFISYATADLEPARSLAFQLKSMGLKVFLSADSLDAKVGSAGWLAAIDDAIEHAGAMLVLVTAAALDSKWVREEWSKYYRLMVDNQSGRLFCLRLGGPPIEKLPLTLKLYQVIDSSTGQIEPGHLTRILDLVQKR